jgi:hypothetical protein
LLVTAIANPTCQSKKSEAFQRTVIVFDNTANMNFKTNSNKTLFDDTITKLNHWLNSISPNHRVAIIDAIDTNSTNNANATVLAEFTNNKKELKQKITSLQNTNIPSNLNSSIELAKKLIEQDNFSYNNSKRQNINDANFYSNTRILVFTADDNLKKRLNNSTKVEEKVMSNSRSSNPLSSPKIEYCLIGQVDAKSHKNVAITNFQSRLSFVDLSRYELFVETSNFSDKIVETQLKIFINDQITDIIPILLNPHEIKSYCLNGEIIPPRIIVTKNTDNNKNDIDNSENNDAGTVIRGELNIKDSFDADNIAHAILPSPKLRKILYYGEDNFFLINALKSYLLQLHGQINFERITSIPDIVPSDSALVINRTVPSNLPTGNLMIFDPRNNCDLFEVGELLSTPTTIDIKSKNSPLTKFTQIGGVEAFGIREINLRKSKDNKKPIVLFSTVENHPVYLAWNFRNENKFNKSPNNNLSEIPTIQVDNSDLDSNLISDFETINNLNKIDAKNKINGFDLESRVLVLGVDISRSDLVLRAAFPILINNALNYFCGINNELEPIYNVGDSLILRMSVVSDWVVIKSPSGNLRTLPVYREFNSTIDTIYIGKLKEIGTYEIFETNINNTKLRQNETNHLRLIKRLACNFAIDKKNITNNFQVKTTDETLEKTSEETSEKNSKKTLDQSPEKPLNTLPIIQISDKNNQAFFDFDNVPLWFLFTVAALILIICNWNLAKL